MDEVSNILVKASEAESDEKTAVKSVSVSVAEPLELEKTAVKSISLACESAGRNMVTYM